MPHFDIVRKNDIEESFRISKIKADYDINNEHTHLHLTGDIEIPQNWNIGLIVGKSGTGKSTIAREIFGEHIFASEYKEKAVIDDMPKVDIDDIQKMFYSVGFGSVPNWLKPYRVLSNGEKMRVDLAKAMLEQDFIVFDEFTSVVDRNVAQNICIAMNKTIKQQNKKFIGVTCHYDVAEYLQPDWIFNTDEMKTFFVSAHDHKKDLKLKDVARASGQNLGVIII